MRPSVIGYSRQMRLPSTTPQPAAFKAGSICSARVSASFMTASSSEVWRRLRQLLHCLIEIDVHRAGIGSGEGFEPVVFQLGFGLRHLVRDASGVVENVALVQREK